MCGRLCTPPCLLCRKHRLVFSSLPGLLFSLRSPRNEENKLLSASHPNFLLAISRAGFKRPCRYGKLCLSCSRYCCPGVAMFVHHAMLALERGLARWLRPKRARLAFGLLFSGFFVVLFHELYLSDNMSSNSKLASSLFRRAAQAPPSVPAIIAATTNATLGVRSYHLIRGNLFPEFFFSPQSDLIRSLKSCSLSPPAQAGAPEA